MNIDARPSLAILYPGDRSARDRSDPTESRFPNLFDAFATAGVSIEPAIYHDEFRDEVFQQLLRLDGVLVWHNPIEGGRDRSQLDAMLREVAAQGVYVSTHPDTILNLGTKDVLLAVRDLPFGTDVHRVDSLAQAEAQLPGRLVGGARVLKQRRGHSGIGIWRVERRGLDRYALRHAQRGAAEEIVDLGGVLQRLARYFDNANHMIDQAWQPRMVEGRRAPTLCRAAWRASAIRPSSRCTRPWIRETRRRRASASTATRTTPASRTCGDASKTNGSACCVIASMSNPMPCRFFGTQTSCSESEVPKAKRSTLFARST